MHHKEIIYIKCAYFEMLILWNHLTVTSEDNIWKYYIWTNLGYKFKQGYVIPKMYSNPNKNFSNAQE